MHMAIPWHEVVLRIGLAAGTGAVLGVERERHGRAAGLRTTMIVCTAAAFAMLISQSLVSDSASGPPGMRADPARLAAGILTGMGFLGGGVIVRQGDSVRGVTTAAVVWFSTILGLAYGVGLKELGLLGFAFALLALLILPWLEGHIRSDRYVTVTVVTTLTGATDIDLAHLLKAAGLTVRGVQLSRDASANRKTTTFEARIRQSPRDNPLTIPENTLPEILRCEGVIQATWN